MKPEKKERLKVNLGLAVFVVVDLVLWAAIILSARELLTLF